DVGVDSPSFEEAGEGILKAGPHREDHARSSAAQEHLMFGVGVLEEKFDPVIAWAIPEIGIDEKQDVLPLNRLLDELDELAETHDTRPLLLRERGGIQRGKALR